MSAEVFRDPVVELYAAGDWHNITDDVRYQGGLTITRGRGGEDDAAPPQTCRLILDDRNGDYNPRNPLGAYYGSLGRNTPLRVALALASTTFDTPATGGWGSTDAVEGQAVHPWTASGGSAADYAVSGGAATHALAAATNIRQSYLAPVLLRDVEVRTTVTIPVTVTGGAIGAANLMLHGQSSPLVYYMLRLLFEPGGTISLDFHHTTSGATLSLTSNNPVELDFTHSPGVPVRVAFGIEGRTLRAKVWPASDPEPYGWFRFYTDEDTAAARTAIAGQAGWVGIRSSLVTGNTNGPVTLSYADFEVRSPRFAGEVSVWPSTRDVSGADVTTTVTASGPRRRGTQGASTLDSPLRRQTAGDLPFSGGDVPVAYWPLEDRFRQVPGEVLAVAGGGQLGFVAPTVGTTAGRISWAADNDLPGSLAVPTLTGGASLIGELNPPVGLSGWGDWYLNWAQRMNASDGSFSLFTTENTFIQVVLMLDPGSSATTLGVYLSVSSLGISEQIMTYAFASKEDVESWHLFGFHAEQTSTGGNVTFDLLVDGVTVATHSRTGLDLNRLTTVQLSSVTNAQHTTSIGHVAVYELRPDMTRPFEAFGGNVNETAGQRMQRLCREEGVEFDWTGTLEIGVYPPVSGDTPAVGAQQSATLVGLLDDAAAVDFGWLFEQRALAGYHYRTRRSLYGQAAAVTLDYAEGEIAPEWRPVDDDRHLRNDVTAQRLDGGSYRHQVTSGRLSTADVEDGGAGRYRETLTVNVQSDLQLPGIAEWRAHLGTVDEPRYPAVRVQLHGHGLRGNAAKLAALLDLDVGSRLVVTNTGADGVDQLVVGYVEALTRYVHEFELVCAPASPYRVPVLDDTAARLDSDTSSLAAPITAGASSWQVVTTDPLELWTTDPTQFPLDVLIGGERVTLSGITGTTSPQTFTASARAVNGISKPHAAGVEVHIADPIYLGL